MCKVVVTEIYWHHTSFKKEEITIQGKREAVTVIASPGSATAQLILWQLRQLLQCTAAPPVCSVWQYESLSRKWRASSADS
jgi:hypothetical protein